MLDIFTSKVISQSLQKALQSHSELNAYCSMFYILIKIGLISSSSLTVCKLSRFEKSYRSSSMKFTLLLNIVVVIAEVSWGTFWIKIEKNTKVWNVLCIVALLKYFTENLGWKLIESICFQNVTKKNKRRTIEKLWECSKFGGFDSFVCEKKDTKLVSLNVISEHQHIVVFHLDFRNSNASFCTA